MAYSRYPRYFRRRRSYASGRKRSVRYSRGRYGRRRSFRSYRSRRYRPRRYVRKLKGISPYDKKSDTMMSWCTLDSTPDATLGTSTGPFDANNTSVFCFCPTWIPSDTKSENEAGNRLRDGEAWKIYFTGFAERSLIRVMTGTIWRRVAVWSYDRIEAAMPVPSEETGEGLYYRRNLNYVDPTRDDFMRWLFQGTRDVDFQPWSYINAPLNKSHFSVAMDRTITINPNHAHTQSGDAGQIFTKRDWFRGGKIVFDNIENGTSAESDGWSSYKRESKGNLYIVDIFFSPDQTDYGYFQTESTRYWLEG